MKNFRIFWFLIFILIITALFFSKEKFIIFSQWLKSYILAPALLFQENNSNYNFNQQTQEKESLSFENNNKFEESNWSDLVFEKEQFLNSRENINFSKDISLAQIQKQLDNISENIDILEAKIKKIKDEKLEKQELEEQKEDSEELEVEEQEETLGQEIGQFLCPILPNEIPIQNKVIFNEIAWMGTKSDKKGLDEWIELKNISQENIDLTGWQIQNRDQKIKIVFQNNQISPNGFFLLERTDDNTVPNVKADFLYTGALKNENEALYLFDQNCQLQDFVEANPFWLAGDNETKKTMERKPDLTWQTSLVSGGTPKKENSLGDFYFGINDFGFQKTNYPLILISEVKMSEKKGDKDIFIELYNPNEKDVDLTGWYLQRKTKDSQNFSSFVSKNLFQDKKIKAKDYFLLARKDSSFLNLADIVFEDTLTQENTICLKNPNQEIVECLDLPDNLLGKSWARIYDQEQQQYLNQFEFQTLTPKEKNNRFPVASFSFNPLIPKEKEEILFDGSLSFDPDGKISLFYWDFGDNSISTSTLATTSHIYQSSGHFLITLKVFDERGVFSLATSSIEILKIPQAILEIKQNKFIFSGEEKEDIFPQTLIIENQGDKELDWKIISSSEWLIFNPNFGKVSPLNFSNVEIFLNINNFLPGTYFATATIDCFDCQNNFQEISIQLKIFPKTKRSVVINEVAWMGTKASDWDEWIELYNNTGNPLDLLGWKIKKNDEVFIEISTTSFIFDFYLLERAEKATNILADFVYGGQKRMKNTECEILSLYNNFDELVDQTICLENGEWPAGKASPEYFSMERLDSNFSGAIISNWKNNNGIIKNGFDANQNPINGTPKAKNSVAL